MAFNGDSLWVTGQNYDRLVKIDMHNDMSMTYYAMPEKSGPHGIEFDRNGNLWVALEFRGEVVRLDPNNPTYETAQVYDVNINCTNCTSKINSHPHGLALAPNDGSVWYTGKATGTLGRINANGTVETFPISKISDPTAIVGSVPIYIHPSDRGDMWFTELVGNAVGRISPDGTVEEIKIPTPNSRPISILEGPDGNMWFSEEAANKIARVRLHGCTGQDCITEFALPKSQDNDILAALAFDRDGNLWVQQYVDQNNPSAAGSDRIIKIDKRILTAKAGDRLDFQTVEIPTAKSVMHRIALGPDGNLWFTELHTDKVGEIPLMAAF